MPNKITECGMLMSLTIESWSARKHDANVSADVAKAHNASNDAGRYNKMLVDKNALAPVQSAANTAREFFMTNTLPWLDKKGQRIMPATNFIATSAKINELHIAFDAAVAAFLAEYPRHREEAHKRLNGLFSPADYPDESVLRRKFRFAVDVMPIPDSEDFRVDLGAENVARIQADISAKLTEAQQVAMADIWQRIHDTVTHMRDRLKTYEVNSEGKVIAGVFRDTLVSNLRDLVELLPRLNFTGDARLDDMRVRLSQSLTVHDAQTLRDSDVARKENISAADQILADMGLLNT